MLYVALNCLLCGFFPKLRSTKNFYLTTVGTLALLLVPALHILLDRSPFIWIVLYVFGSLPTVNRFFLYLWNRRILIAFIIHVNIKQEKIVVVLTMQHALEELNVQTMRLFLIVSKFLKYSVEILLMIPFGIISDCSSFILGLLFAAGHRCLGIPNYIRLTRDNYYSKKFSSIGSPRLHSRLHMAADLSPFSQRHSYGFICHARGNFIFKRNIFY